MSSDDIVERLTRSQDFKLFVAGDGENGIRMMTEVERRQEAADEIDRLRATLDAIDALHQPDGYDRSDILIACVGCGDFWPCDTARLLRPEEAA